MKNADKTNMNELVQLVAEKTGLSRNVADGFLKKLFAVIEDGLRADGAVKINNFGTFRLQWNEPRKSVDVNTGEEILIEGYNKVVFLPENFLKEKVNEPFAYLETVVLDGDKLPEQQKTEDIPLQKLDMQAEEIKDILADIQELDAGREPEVEVPASEHVLEAGGTTEGIPEPVAQDEPVHVASGNVESIEDKQPEFVAVHAPVTEKGGTDIAEESNRQEKTQQTENIMDNDLKENGSVQSQPAEKPATKKPVKSNQGWKVASWVIIGVVCVLVILYFALQHKIEQWADNYLNKQQETEIVVEPEVAPAPVSIFDQPRIYTEFITTERLTPGSRLAWLSTKYYGSPYFWVYIYEANKDYILNPNHVLIGTPVKVPKLDPALIDTNNPECLEYARKLHGQYVK